MTQVFVNVHLGMGRGTADNCEINVHVHILFTFFVRCSVRIKWGGKLSHPLVNHAVAWLQLQTKKMVPTTFQPALVA